MQIHSPSSGFTRPSDTTQYGAGDLIANSTTAALVAPLSWTLQGSNIIGPFSVSRARLIHTASSATAASFRLHLYSASPTVTNGDNGAFESTQAATYLGYISLDGSSTPGDKFSDGHVCIGAVPAESAINCRLPSGNTIYGLVEAVGTYTPASGEVFTVILDLIEHFPRG